ncbi:methylglyoxal synthase [Flammeovirgaceae bacterium 311]|nr:methylglyoxal synthase [Flammeovirgaceae bacterium 311]
MNTKTKAAVALVAHDNKKKDLVEWCQHNKELLEEYRLLATGTTGKLINEETGLEVKLLKSGPLGGDLQIGAMIAEGEVDYLIFLWDPLEAQPHDPDIKALLRIAAVWNIPVACNRATADYIFTSRLLNEVYNRQHPNYSAHLNRNIGSGE